MLCFPVPLHSLHDTREDNPASSNSTSSAANMLRMLWLLHAYETRRTWCDKVHGNNTAQQAQHTWPVDPGSGNPNSTIPALSKAYAMHVSTTKPALQLAIVPFNSVV
jgi:hypothetical protein